MPPGSSPAALETAAIADFQRSAMAVNTGLTYQSDWQQFERWCRLRGAVSLPATPQTVAAYLAAQANLADPDGRWTYAPSTLGRRLAAITKAHELAGVLSPCREVEVTTTMSGIRRQRRSPPRRAAPRLLAELRTVLGRIALQRFPVAVIGRRDVALLLMGFGGAFRRSELIALTVGDVTLHPQDGLHVHLQHSNTDQEGRGEVKALPYGTHPDTCPPCAYLRWRQVLDAAEIGGRVEVLRLLRGQAVQDELTHLCRDTGDQQPAEVLTGDRPLFRPIHKTGLPGSGPLSGHVVGAVVKRRASAAGLNPARLSGHLLRAGFVTHSLRAGFVTQAVRGGADAGSIMRQTGHRSHAMVELYRRENAPLINNAVTTSGL